jgi:hypothetical protein
MRRKIADLHRNMSSQFRPRMTAVLNKGASRFETDLIRKHLTGGTTPTKLGRRTGALARSGRHEVRELGAGTLQLVVGFGKGVPYAKVHEGPPYHSGIIKPKKARYLAIPTQHAKTRKASVSRAVTSIRTQYPDLFVIKKAGRTPMLARTVGKKKKVQVMFILKKQVYIRPRMNMQNLWKKHAPKIQKDVRKEIEALIKARRASLKK